jgi:hypothetical protein
MNNVEDKLEKSTEQEALRLEVAKKVAVGPPAKLQEVTSVRGGTPPTPPERRWDGRPVCWWCGKPVLF